MERPTSLAGAPIAVALLACAAGCGGPASLARKAFSDAYFCPKDRVTVTPHVERAGAGDPAAAPPPDVAGDPERLAMWRRKQDRDAQAAAETRRDRRVIDADGCGHRQTYECVDMDDTDWFCREPVKPLPLPPLSASPLLRSALSDAGADVGAAATQIEQVKHILKIVEDNPRLAVNVPDLRARLARMEQELKLVQGLRPMHLGVALEDRPGRGVAVVLVTPGGRADGKLRAGDLIVEADDTPVTNMVDLLRTLALHRDEALRLRVDRGDETVAVTVDQGAP